MLYIGSTIINGILLEDMVANSLGGCHQCRLCHLGHYCWDHDVHLSGTGYRELTSVTFYKTTAVLSELIVGNRLGTVRAAGVFILVLISPSSSSLPLLSFLQLDGHRENVDWSRNILASPSLIMVVPSMVAAPIGTMLIKQLNIKVLHEFFRYWFLWPVWRFWIGIMLKSYSSTIAYFFVSSEFVAKASFQALYFNDKSFF